MVRSALVSPEARIYNGIYTALTDAGMATGKASKYAIFAVEVYQYVMQDDQLQGALMMSKATYDMHDGAKTAVAAYQYAAGADALQLEASAARFTGRAEAGVGGAISAFVDYFAGYAKANHIELNECSLAITKVILDVLSSIALSGTGVGIWLAALQVFTVANDTRSMIQSCAS